MTDTWTCWRDPSHRQIETTRFGWPRCVVCHAAPESPDQWAYAKDADVTVDLFVPAAGALATTLIAPRSGIVGVPYEGDHIEAYYEGWLYGQTSDDAHENWRRAVESAAGRLVTAYPTVARSLLPADSLVRVGHFSVRRGIRVDDPSVLEAWLTA